MTKETTNKPTQLELTPDIVPRATNNSNVAKLVKDTSNIVFTFKKHVEDTASFDQVFESINTNIETLSQDGTRIEHKNARNDLVENLDSLHSTAQEFAQSADTPKSKERIITLLAEQTAEIITNHANLPKTNAHIVPLVTTMTAENKLDAIAEKVNLLSTAYVKTPESDPKLLENTSYNQGLDLLEIAANHKQDYLNLNKSLDTALNVMTKHIGELTPRLNKLLRNAETKDSKQPIKEFRHTAKEFDLSVERVLSRQLQSESTFLGR